MTDSYLTLLETISDPWALGFVSFLLAGFIVVCGTLASESRSLDMEPTPEEADLTTKNTPDPLPYEPKDFFDKVTRFHNAL